MLRYYVFNTHAHINMTTIVDTGPCILQFYIYIHLLRISMYISILPLLIVWSMQITQILKALRTQHPQQNCRGSNHTGSETSPICEGIVGLRQHQLQREDHTTDGSREGCGHLNVCRAPWDQPKDVLDTSPMYFSIARHHPVLQ